jgi:predicted CoA-binding protein
VNAWNDFEAARHILTSYKTFAVVGCSSDPMRPSHGVSRFLMMRGYDIIPVNPNEKSVHGKTAYADLRSAAEEAPIEVVDIFRRSDQVLPHVEEAIEIGAKAVWMQLGVINEEAAERADAAGLEVVMDRCPAIDHPRIELS